MPPRTRQTFQQQLDAVEEELQKHARLVMRALDRALQALLSGDEQLADMVIAEDDEAAHKLMTGWNLGDGGSLLATEVSFVGAGEAGPLVDRYPPLRLYLPPDLEALDL